MSHVQHSKQAEQATMGNLIVIEGQSDNLRDEQFLSLVAQLKRDGHEVVTFSFPRLEASASHFIKQYTNGHYGSPKEIGPYTSSLFYSLDRFEAGFEIRNALSAGKVVVVNRFTASNMALQGSKFPSPEQRRGYFLWLDNLEYEMLKIPRPDKSFVLRGKDTNELLTQVYDELCLLFPKDFIRVDCSRDGELLEHDTIHTLLYRSVEPFLPVLQKTEKDVVSAEPVKQSTPTPSTTVTLYDAMHHAVSDRLKLVDTKLPRYEIPKLSGTTKKIYVEGMNELFRCYDRLEQQATDTQTKSILQNILPLAAFFSSRASAPHVSNEPIVVLSQFAKKELTGQLDAQTNSLQLTHCSPRNEFDLIAPLMYRYAGQSLEQLQHTLGGLTYVQKEKLLATYLTTPSITLEGAHYSFDCVIDHELFDVIRSLPGVSNLNWQALTPRYGYEVPDEIEAAGMSDEFEGCFDLSLRLYSLLQSEQPDYAALATLRGHKLRCSFQITTRGLQALTKVLTANTVQTNFNLALKQAIEAVHPLTAEQL